MEWPSKRKPRFLQVCKRLHGALFSEAHKQISKGAIDNDTNPLFCHFFQLNHIPNAYKTPHGLAKISAKDGQNLVLENCCDCLVALFPVRQLMQSSVPSSYFNPEFRPNSVLLISFKSSFIYEVTGTIVGI